jgi:hypothetical protein
MALLKQVNKGPLQIPGSLFDIHLHYHHNQLIPEQNTGQRNPMSRLMLALHIT